MARNAVMRLCREALVQYIHTVYSFAFYYTIRIMKRKKILDDNSICLCGCKCRRRQSLPAWCCVHMLLLSSEYALEICGLPARCKMQLNSTVNWGQPSVNSTSTLHRCWHIFGVTVAYHCFLRKPCCRFRIDGTERLDTDQHGLLSYNIREKPCYMACRSV